MVDASEYRKKKKQRKGRKRRKEEICVDVKTNVANRDADDRPDDEQNG